jgi:hypothetical protein
MAAPFHTALREDRTPKAQAKGGNGHSQQGQYRPSAFILLTDILASQISS